MAQKLYSSEMFDFYTWGREVRRVPVFVVERWLRFGQLGCLNDKLILEFRAWASARRLPSQENKNAKNRGPNRV